MPLSANNRAFDIAPYMFSLLTIDPADTPRGIDWTIPKRLIPRRVSFQRDDDQAVMLTDVTFESETFAYASQPGDAPIEPPPPEPPPPPPLLCGDPAALNYGGLAPCIYPPPGIVIVMTPRHIGRSLDFFTSTTPTWFDVGPNIGHGGVGYYYNMALNPDTGELWVITKSVEAGTLASNGMWYCPDATLAPAGWTLVYSQQNYYDDAIATYPAGEPQQLNALSLSEDGTIYAQAYYHNRDINSYVFGTGASCSYVYTQWLLDPILHFNTPNNGHQFSLSGGPGGSARISFISVIINADGWIWANRVLEGVPGNFSSMSNPSIPGMGYIVYDSSQWLCLYADYGGALAPIWPHAFEERPIVLQDGHIFWTQVTDNSLMIDGVVQAYPYTHGGVTGVFNTGPAKGGAYCFPETYAHIAWVAASANCDIRNIAYTEDGGFTWLTKDGNWAAAMGEVWEGNIGDTKACPMIQYGSL
jgi:hypothetical protein